MASPASETLIVLGPGGVPEDQSLYFFELGVTSYIPDIDKLCTTPMQIRRANPPLGGVEVLLAVKDENDAKNILRQLEDQPVFTAMGDQTPLAVRIEYPASRLAVEATNRASRTTPRRIVPTVVIRGAPAEKAPDLIRIVSEKIEDALGPIATAADKPTKITTDKHGNIFVNFESNDAAEKIGSVLSNFSVAAGDGSLIPLKASLQRDKGLATTVPSVPTMQAASLQSAVPTSSPSPSPSKQPGQLLTGGPTAATPAEGVSTAAAPFLPFSKSTASDLKTETATEVSGFENRSFNKAKETVTLAFKWPSTDADALSATLASAIPELAEDLRCAKFTFNKTGKAFIELSSPEPAIRLALKIHNRPLSDRGNTVKMEVRRPTSTSGFPATSQPWSGSETILTMSKVPKESTPDTLRAKLQEKLPQCQINLAKATINPYRKAWLHFLSPLDALDVLLGLNQTRLFDENSVEFNFVQFIRAPQNPVESSQQSTAVCVASSAKTDPSAGLMGSPERWTSVATASAGIAEKPNAPSPSTEDMRSTTGNIGTQDLTATEFSLESTPNSVSLRLRLRTTNLVKWVGRDATAGADGGVDAIVNAANELLEGGGGIDGAVHEAAGPKLLLACQKLPLVASANGRVRCPTGQAKMTLGPFGAGLGAMHVIHAVGPRGTMTNRKALLASAYDASLKLAANHDVTIVAFPAISTGIFGYPKQEAAEVALSAICSFVSRGPSTTRKLHTIDLCLLDPESFRFWQEAARKAGLTVLADAPSATTVARRARLPDKPASPWSLQPPVGRNSATVARTLEALSGLAEDVEQRSQKDCSLKGTWKFAEMRAAATKVAVSGMLLYRVRSRLLPRHTDTYVEYDGEDDEKSRRLPHPDSNNMIFELQLLLGEKNNILFPLVRGRDVTNVPGRSDSIAQTASTALQESTGDQLQREAVASLDHAFSTGQGVHFYQQADIAIFLVNVDSPELQPLQEATEDFPAVYRKFLHAEGKEAPAEHKIFRTLIWQAWQLSMALEPPTSPTLATQVKPRLCEYLLKTAFSKNTTLCNFFIGAHKEGSKKAAQEALQDVETLQAKLMAAEQQAEAERPTSQARAQALSIPTSDVPALESGLYAPTDLVPLPVSDKETQKVLAEAQISTGAHCVRKVNIPAREQRFEAFRNSLPAGLRNEVRVFHGTPLTPSASSIARTGPDLQRAGSNIGIAYGAGFYTSEEPRYPTSVARSGSVLVARALPGRALSQGGSQTTAATLLNMDPPHHSISPKTPPWHILFHPDSLRVEYIIDFSPSEDTEKMEIIRKAHEKAIAEREVKEEIRLANLQKAQARLQMINYFVEKMKTLQIGLDHSNVAVRRHFLEMETVQFKQGLPMYARKQDIVDMIKRHPCCIVKGGTGTGKTVSVPQWVYDEIFFAQNKPHVKVAVLVPRRAIAEGLAAYISKVRQVELGEQVGLGVSGSVRMSDRTVLLFATYGFFRAITQNKKHFAGYGCVILDEAHERNPDADILLPLMAQACIARSDFKAVVMSATIDVDQFASMLAENMGGALVPNVAVAGVTYPVDDVWSSTKWDALKDGAVKDLCNFVLRVFSTEAAGNLLVFLPTISAVEEAVEATATALQHDPNVVVKPLYAGLKSWDKAEVEYFADLSKYPANEGKRLICYSTNVAEAGITIPGITAVVETGCEIQVTYDPILRLSFSEVGSISKASQTQRRGRAGRTAPGRCYCTYSKEDYEAMPDYSAPAVTRINLESFYLALVSAGFDPVRSLVPVSAPNNGVNRDPSMDINSAPSQVTLLDAPIDRLQAARTSLLRLEAISEDPKTQLAVATTTGKVLTRLPIDFNLAKGLLAAATSRLACSTEFAKLACMAMSADRKGVFKKNAPDAARAEMIDATGDHLTYLNVYNGYLANKRSQEWCDQKGVMYEIMSSADALLKKLHRAMGSAVPPIPLIDQSDPVELKNGLLRALVAAFASNVATANDGNNPKQGFTIVNSFTSDPVVGAKLHNACVLLNSAQSKESRDGPLGVILYQTRSRRTTPKQIQDILVGITALPSGMLEDEISQALSDEELVTELRAALKSSKRHVKTWEVGSEGKVPNKGVAEAIRNNLENVKYEFPLAKIVWSCDSKALETAKIKLLAPTSCLSSVAEEVQHAVDSAQPGRKTSTVPADILNKHFMVTGKPSPTGMAVVNQLKREYYTRNPPLKTASDAYIIITADHADGSVTVESLNCIVQLVMQRLLSLMGLESPTQHPSLLPVAAVTTALSALQMGSASSSPLAVKAVEYQTKMRLLGDRDDTRAETAIIAKCGRGKEAAMMLLARWMILYTDMFPYGGFLRDYVVGDRTHQDVDLDVALPLGKGWKPADGLHKIAEFAERHSIRRDTAMPPNFKGPSCMEVYFRAADGTLFPIELVDSESFTKKDPRVDFDVNNLKLARDETGSVMLALKRPEFAGPLEAIVDNILHYRLVVLKSASEVSDRIQKMQKRGWTVLFKGV